MTDARSRALERGADSGDLGERVAVLVDRVRRGALTDERLRCAAFLGDAAAVIVAGERGLSVPTAPTEFTKWYLSLERVGPDVSLRTGDALTRVFYPFWLRSPLGKDPRTALAAIEDLLACPCVPHTQAAERVSRAISIARPDWNDAEDEGGIPQRPQPGPVAWLAWVASSCAAWTLRERPPGEEFNGIAGPFNAHAFEPCLEQLRLHLLRCLMPWALGSTDLVTEADGADDLRSRLLDWMDETLG